MANQVIWTGFPPSSFGNPERAGRGRISLVYDKLEDGSADETYWELVKSAGVESYRTEFRNIVVNGARYVWREGTTYTISWKANYLDTKDIRSKIPIFQWKSYGDNMHQVYPFLLELINGAIKLRHYPWDETPGNESSAVDLFRVPFDASVWHTFAMTLHLSRHAERGWIEFAIDGQPMELRGERRFYGRTLDDHSNEPKFGLYTRGYPEQELRCRLKDMSVTIV